MQGILIWLLFALIDQCLLVTHASPAGPEVAMRNLHGVGRDGHYPREWTI